MKACKGLFLFCFLGIAISSCFDPPVFTDTPKIFFNKILFKEGVETDSLILYLDFQDGDGDLGLTGEMTAPPYNPSFYYLADGVVVDGKGRLNQVAAISQTIPNPYYPQQEPPNLVADLIIPNGATGQLATSKTRTKPNYGYLPAYDASECNYTNPPLYTLVAENDNLVDASYTIIDTLIRQGTTLRYFVIEDPAYYKENPQSQNIDVEFWYQENSLTFKLFDWSTVLNCTDFDGRFLFIPHKLGEPMEGTLKYAMLSDAFLDKFSVKRLKLKIRIRDRALNESNEVETPEFFLTSICSNCD